MYVDYDDQRRAAASQIPFLPEEQSQSKPTYRNSSVDPPLFRNTTGILLRATTNTSASVWNLGQHTPLWTGLLSPSSLPDLARPDRSSHIYNQRFPRDLA